MKSILKKKKKKIIVIEEEETDCIIEGNNLERRRIRWEGLISCTAKYKPVRKGTMEWKNKKGLKGERD